MNPGDLRVLTRFIGCNLTQTSLRRDHVFSHILREEDSVVVIETHEMETSERPACVMLTKFGILWCFIEDIERHTAKA